MTTTKIEISESGRESLESAGYNADAVLRSLGEGRFGELCDHVTGHGIRPATLGEALESIESGTPDGAFTCEGRACYVAF